MHYSSELNVSPTARAWVLHAQMHSLFGAISIHRVPGLPRAMARIRSLRCVMQKTIRPQSLNARWTCVVLLWREVAVC